MACATQIAAVRAVSTGSFGEWDEQDVVARAKRRSPNAFDELVKHYERNVFRLAQNVTRNDEDAEDVMQNAFVKAFQNLPGFRQDSRFYTWLVRITVNEALMALRRRPRHKQVSIDESRETDHTSVPLEIEDWGLNPEQRYSEEELQRILATTINELTPGHRTVFLLREVDGLSTAETAQALALSSSAVKTRLQRARVALRKSLDKYFRPTGARRLRRGGAVGDANARHMSQAPENGQPAAKPAIGRGMQGERGYDAV